MTEEDPVPNQTSTSKPQYVQRAAENSTLILGLLLIFAILFLVFIGAIGGAFLIIGFPPNIVFNLFVLSVLGSFVNIPIRWYECGIPSAFDDIPEDQIGSINEYFKTNLNPQRKRGMLAINVGGAIIPISISIILVFLNGLWLWILPGFIAVSVVTYYTSRVVPGRGIALPIFAGPFTAALFSIFVSPMFSPQVAYITGTLGTLFGADILNMRKLLKKPKINCGILSIGGAGTFDGIFLTGIIAVFLSLFLP
ncbi:MAG: DUF1614 domain-containing protein [Candidatus Ranarchaeia archaeon]|jgi:uncharacterized membrane protein